MATCWNSMGGDRWRENTKAYRHSGTGCSAPEARRKARSGRGLPQPRCRVAADPTVGRRAAAARPQSAVSRPGGLGAAAVEPAGAAAARAPQRQAAKRCSPSSAAASGWIVLAWRPGASLRARVSSSSRTRSVVALVEGRGCPSPTPRPRRASRSRPGPRRREHAHALAPGAMCTQVQPRDDDDEQRRQRAGRGASEDPASEDNARDCGPRCT